MTACVAPAAGCAKRTYNAHYVNIAWGCFFLAQAERWWWLECSDFLLTPSEISKGVRELASLGCLCVRAALRHHSTSTGSVGGARMAMCSMCVGLQKV